MGFLRKAGGAWAPAPALRKAAGTWAIAHTWKKVAGAWILISGAVTATPNKTSLSAIGTTVTVTTSGVTVTPSGGTAPYTYGWAKVTGGSINSQAPASATNTFTSATNMTVGETRIATFRCTVTDANGLTGTCDVSITLKRVAAPSLALNKTSLSIVDNTTSETTASVTATASSGTAPYSYKWTKVTGAGTLSGTGIACDSSTAATTTFTSSSLAAGETRTATWRCTVTDANGLTATGDVSVTISRAATLTAGVTPASVSGSAASGTITSGTATASASGGSGPFTYQWNRVSGSAAITAVNSTSAGSTFKSTTVPAGGSQSAVFACTITDNVGQTAVTANVTITLNNTTVTATYTPAAGTYSASDTGLVEYSVSCSATATWTWSATNTTGLSVSLASGGSGTSITFTLSAALHADRVSTITLNSGGKTWTLNLTAFQNPAGTSRGG